MVPAVLAVGAVQEFQAALEAFLTREEAVAQESQLQNNNKNSYRVRMQML